jgi:hypothetical protein
MYNGPSTRLPGRPAFGRKRAKRGKVPIGPGLRNRGEPSNHIRPPGHARTGFTRPPGHARTGFTRPRGHARTGFTRPPGHARTGFTRPPGHARTGFAQRAD